MRLNKVALTDPATKGEKRADVIVVVPLEDDNGKRLDLYLPVEFKHRLDPDTQLQVAGYEVRIYETLRQSGQHALVLPSIVHTGTDKPQVRCLQEIMVGEQVSIVRTQDNSHMLSLHLQLTDDAELLADDFGVFLYVQKRIKAMSDMILAVTIGKCYNLIAMGRLVEVVWLVDMMLTAKASGVTETRIRETEVREFPHVKEENRIMAKFSLATDRAREEGIKQGIERGIEQERNKITLATDRAREEGIKQGIERGIEQERNKITLATDRAREEGIKQGIERGIERGIEQERNKTTLATDRAREEGIKQGIERGIEQERNKIAQQLLEAGMDDATVCKIAKLNKRELTSLKKKQQQGQ